MAYVAGGLGVALRGQGVSPGELGRVEWLTWVLRDPASKMDRRAGRCKTGSFPRDGQGLRAKL